MDEKTSFENRIFKLSTGEKVSPAELEKLISEKCHYVKYVAVGPDKNNNPVALIFPNQRLLVHPDYKVTPEQGCFCPRSIDELGRCLSGCLKLVNHEIEDGSKIKSAAIINADIPGEAGKPSLEFLDNYKTLLHEMHGKDVPANEEVYFIKDAI